MKNIVFLSSISFIFLSFLLQQGFQIDTKASSVTFEIGGPFGTKAKGSFSSPEGNIVFDPQVWDKGKFDVRLNVLSINTGNEKRDTHLKKEEFFDITKYNTILFNSTKIEKDNDGFVVTGQLKIKNVVKNVKIPFTYSTSLNKGTFKGVFVVNRRDYGVGGSSLLIGDQATVHITLFVLL